MRCALYTCVFFILWDVQRLQALQRGESTVSLLVLAFHFARAGFIVTVLEYIASLAN